jgi:hypothetical protein
MMKKFARKACATILLLAGFITTQAQENVEDFLKADAADAEVLIKAYLDPFAKSVSIGMSQGWYNTAKAHKLGGFDITATVNMMSIPDNELFYNVAKLNLQNIRLAEESPDYQSVEVQNAPTVVGPKRAPVFEAEFNGVTQSFSGPKGLDIKSQFGRTIVPVPMIQLGLGLPKGTDIKFRFIPKRGLGEDASVGMFGIGIMHDVKQWIPGMKTLPFDLSGFAGYTRLKVTVDVPEDDFAHNGSGELAMDAFTLQGVISKKISVLTLYGGLGYNVASSRMVMLGSYDIDQDGNFDSSEVDPVDIKFAASGPRITGGFRLKIAVITLHTDYTLQKYSSLTVGFGINVR